MGRDPMCDVLRDHACYVELGPVEVEEDGKRSYWPRPRQAVLEGSIVLRQEATVQVSVQALLDPGTDITLVTLDKLRELEREVEAQSGEKQYIPVRRRFRSVIRGQISWEPAFNLAFVFPAGQRYSSRYGFIVPRGWSPDVGDVWLGQDILSQLVVTFNGPEGTVTIVDPKCQQSG
jgi:hypothetical protein